MVVCTFIDVHALPEEVLLHVLYFLPPKDLLLNCATVSKYFQELAYNERLWWHHVFLENKHYSQEWLSNTQTAVDPYTPMTPITPLSARTPISSSSTSSARIVWRRDRYVYHVGLDERFDRIYSHYDNDNDTHVLNPRHYYIESCLVQASSRENDHARDGETDVTPASKGYKTNGGANGFLDRNKAIENKISKGLKTPGKRHRLTLTSVLAPVNNTPNTPTTPSSPTTPQSPVLWLNNLFTNTVNNIRYGKPPANVSHRSICLIGGFSERIQDDSQREQGVHMFDCARQQFRAPIEQFIKNEKPTLYGKHSAVLFDEDETRGIQGRIFLFGGSDGTTVTDELFIYDLDRSTIIKADIKEPKPAARVNHCACRIGDYHMYVLGGGVGKDMVPSSEIWVLDTRTLTWELLEQANNDVFTPRLGFTIAAINDKILLHGGAYWIQNKTEARWREAYKQTMLFDTKTRWWTLLRTGGSTPEVGSFPTSCLIGTQWFFISGATESNVTEEIYCFDTVTYKWRHMKEKNYLADGLACCPYTHYGPNRQQKILIFGGYRYAPLMSVSVLNVKWVDLMVKNGIMPLKQVQQGVCVPGVATPIDQPMDHSSMFAYY